MYKIEINGFNQHIKVVYPNDIKEKKWLCFLMIKKYKKNLMKNY
jgi:hypothetical protein